MLFYGLNNRFFYKANDQFEQIANVATIPPYIYVRSPDLLKIMIKLRLSKNHWFTSILMAKKWKKPGVSHNWTYKKLIKKCGFHIFYQKLISNFFGFPLNFLTLNTPVSLFNYGEMSPVSFLMKIDIAYINM